MASHDESNDEEETNFKCFAKMLRQNEQYLWTEFEEFSLYGFPSSQERRVNLRGWQQFSSRNSSIFQ